MLYREILEIATESGKYYDITDRINAAVKNSKAPDGTCNVFLRGTTAGLILNEDDKMLMADFKKLFDFLAPEEKLYQHPENAFAHLRASMLNNSLTIPVASGRLLLGRWQSIMLWEFDTEARKREVVVTVSF